MPAMIYQEAGNPPTNQNGESLLEAHIETWGPTKNADFPGGECQLSLDSSELNNVASPFDDIGYLAGHPTASKTKKETNEKKADPIAEESVLKPPSSLGKFLESDKAEAEQGMPTDPNRPVRGLARRGRLDKTMSKRNMFEEEEASLALSAVMKPKKTKEAKGGRNLFDFSKNSLGLGSKGNKTRGFEQSNGTIRSTSSVTSKNGSKKSRFSDSKSSFGISVLGSSKSTEGSRSFGSKLSSIMRVKDSSRSSKMDETMNTLASENAELLGENNKLQAKLSEVAAEATKQQQLSAWNSIEELANTTTEMHQYKTLCELTELEIEKLHSQLAAFRQLVAAKERSLANLEMARNAQEKRIGYLELQCLQNDIDLDSDDERMLYEEEASLKDGTSILPNESEESVRSFADEDDEDDIGNQSVPDTGNDSAEDSVDLSKALSDDASKSCASTASSKPDVRPDSWLALDLDAPRKISSAAIEKAKRTVARRGSSVNIKGISLGNFLETAELDEKEEDNDLTDTWAPKSLVFEKAKGEKPSQVTDDEDKLPLPGPPALDATFSAPVPASRKTASTASASASRNRNKSPGKRRRLKDRSKSAEGSNLLPSGSGHRLPNRSKSADGKDLLSGSSHKSGSRSPSNRKMLRSKSPGNRRRIREGLKVHSADNLTSMNKNSEEGNSSFSGRRKTRLNSSLRKDLDRRMVGLDRGSAHRRRPRKDNEADKKAVLGALDKALGSSNHGEMNDLMDDPPAPQTKRTSPSSSALPRKSSTKPSRSKSDGTGSRSRG